MMMACDCDGRGCTLCNGADVVRDARTALRELQGTPEWRFHLLLQQLAQRFPDTAAVSAEPYELRFLSWLDDLKSRA